MDYARIEREVLDQMTRTRLPGVSMAIVQGGRTEWARGFGLRDIASGAPVTPSTVFAIASISKSFTALAVMQLVEQGKLDLDDPIERYLDFGIRPHGESIRIRHFLSHSSGIPALAYIENIIDGLVGSLDRPLRIAGYDDMLAFMRDAGDWVVGPPGRHYHYLNEGYVLVSAIIEQVSGERFEDYLRAHIVEPLGMTATCFDRATFERTVDRATPYLIRDKGGPEPSDYAFGRWKGDACVISSADDLARYVAMYLNDGELDGSRLASAASIARMCEPEITEPGENGPYGGVSYGLGLQTAPDFLGHRLVGHSGSVLTSTSYMGFIPDRGLGVVVLAGGMGYSPIQLGRFALAVALGENPERLPFVRREVMFERVKGRYTTYQGTMEVEVAVEGEELVLKRIDRQWRDTTVLHDITIGDSDLHGYFVSGDARYRVTFDLAGDAVDLQWERYRLRRVGPTS